MDTAAATTGSTEAASAVFTLPASASAMAWRAAGFNAKAFAMASACSDVVPVWPVSFSIAGVISLPRLPSRVSTWLAPLGEWPLPLPKCRVLYCVLLFCCLMTSPAMTSPMVTGRVVTSPVAHPA